MTIADKSKFNFATTTNVTIGIKAFDGLAFSDVQLFTIDLVKAAPLFDNTDNQVNFNQVSVTSLSPIPSMMQKMAMIR